MKILFLLLFLTGCGYEIDPQTLYFNRQGVKLIEEKNSTDAQSAFINALGIDPFVSEIHVNLGLTYAELKQPENALKSFESAEKWSQNNQASFVSRFNQGVTRTQNKQIEEALLAYQKALDVVPDSKETKTNIELLISSNSQKSGEGESEEKKDGKGDQPNKDKKDSDKESEDKEKNEEPKEYQKNENYKPREFKGDLSETDVKKILGELKQQEQKIRGQFYRNETKERPRDKDW